MKKARELEKIFKGVANHRRIETIFLLEKQPGLSLQEIANYLGTNYKTTSEHLSRLTRSGIIYKFNEGVLVCHTLSPLGMNILKFLRKLE